MRCTTVHHDVAGTHYAVCKVVVEVIAARGANRVRVVDLHLVLGLQQFGRIIVEIRLFSGVKYRMDDSQFHSWMKGKGAGRGGGKPTGHSVCDPGLLILPHDYGVRKFEASLLAYGLLHLQPLIEVGHLAHLEVNIAGRPKGADHVLAAVSELHLCRRGASHGRSRNRHRIGEVIAAAITRHRQQGAGSLFSVATVESASTTAAQGSADVRCVPW